MGVIKLSLNLNEILKKYANNKSLYIIIIIGIVFMLLPFGGGGQKSDEKAQSYNIYSDEARLSGILSKIDGVEDVSVMITYYGTTSYDVAFEKRVSGSVSEDETTKSEESSVITANGQPLVKGEVYPKAKGVIVIARGVKSPTVKKAITDAVTAALEVSSYRVCVLEGKERN
jgi:stage III sporulation protein AG